MKKASVLGLAVTGLLPCASQASTATYTPTNSTCAHPVDVVVSPVTRDGSVTVSMGYRGLPQASGVCTITKPGRSCENPGINVSHDIYQIRGALTWENGTNLVVFNGSMTIGGCAQMDFTNAPMGLAQ